MSSSFVSSNFDTMLNETLEAHISEKASTHVDRYKNPKCNKIELLQQGHTHKYNILQNLEGICDA